MDEAERTVIAALAGDHAYEKRARAGNWVAMWVFLVGAATIAGVIEAYVRAWEVIQPTPILFVACAAGALAGVLWIRSFNATRYRVGEGVIECSTVWPRRSWRFRFEEIESATLETSHGHWNLVLQLRTGGRRRVVLTQSMRQALRIG